MMNNMKNVNDAVLTDAYYTVTEGVNDLGMGLAYFAELLKDLKSSKNN